jgi:hypothetical protein
MWLIIENKIVFLTKVTLSLFLSHFLAGGGFFFSSALLAPTGAFLI